MRLAAEIEADVTVTRVNNLLLRHYEPGWQYRFKVRPSCALYYVLAGELTVTTPTGGEVLREGDVGIFDAGIPMLLENRAEVPNRCYQISFYADKNMSEFGLPTHLSDAAELRARFAAAYEGYIAHGIGYRLYTRAAILELIAALLAKQADGRQGRHSARLAAVLSYLGENYARPLSLAAISRSVGYSPSHLREIFRAELGVSPIRYINRLRIERACALLHDDIPIWQIAELVGYPNANYFSRLFRAEMGVTPCEYRSKCL